MNKAWIGVRRISEKASWDQYNAENNLYVEPSVEEGLKQEKNILDGHKKEPELFAIVVNRQTKVTDTITRLEINVTFEE